MLDDISCSTPFLAPEPPSLSILASNTSQIKNSDNDVNSRCVYIAILQSKAQNAMGARKGAIVAIDLGGCYGSMKTIHQNFCVRIERHCEQALLDVRPLSMESRH